MRGLNLMLFATLAVAQQAFTPPAELSIINIAETVEGILYGVIKEQFPEGTIEQCIGDVTEAEAMLKSAFGNMQNLTFDNIRQRLRVAGEVVTMIPELLKDCTAVEDDFTTLLKMASIFEHPLSLVIHLGKSLIVNGADIFSKVKLALASYQQGKYFEFGTHIGEALEEAFMKASGNGATVPLKRLIDEKAYSFLIGFFEGVEGNIQVNEQALYNGITGKGVMVYGPVDSVMRGLNNTEGELDQRIWMAIHQVVHTFQEGGDMLLSAGILSKSDLEKVRQHADCLEISTSSEEVSNIFKAAVVSYSDNDHYAVGRAFAKAAAVMCSEQPQLY